MSEVENVGSADQDIQDTDISEGVQECQQAKKEKSKQFICYKLIFRLRYILMCWLFNSYRAS